MSTRYNREAAMHTLDVLGEAIAQNHSRDNLTQWVDRAHDLVSAIQPGKPWATTDPRKQVPDRTPIIVLTGQFVFRAVVQDQMVTLVHAEPGVPNLLEPQSVWPGWYWVRAP